MKLNRIFDFAVILLMLALLPLTASTAEAETVSPGTINMGSSVLKANANTNNAPIVVYADDEYYVTEYGNEYLTLFARFNTIRNENTTYYGYTAEYSNSYVKSRLDSVYNSKFSSYEKKVLLSRDLTGGYRTSDDIDKIMGATVKNVKFWAPTIKEAQNIDINLRRYPNWRDTQYAVNNQWLWSWLSTPGNTSGNAAVLDCRGDIDQYGLPINTMFLSASIRGCFHLDKSAILLTFDSEGKQSGSIGPSALKAVEKYDRRYYKVTIRDDSRKNFKVSQCPNSYNSDEKKIKVHYSGAVTGSDNYISAVITDSTGENIRYYGRIAEATASSGEVTIDMKGKAEDGDRLFVFNEKISSKGYSDLSSDLKEVKLDNNISTHPWDYYLSWNSDGSFEVVRKCFICGHDEYLDKSKYTSDIKIENIKAVSCEEDGEDMYYVAVTVTEDDSNTVTVKDNKSIVIPATGHSWSTVTFHWDDDGCTYADRYCTACSKRQSKTRDNGEITTHVRSKKDPTCTEAGEIVYYAEVEFDKSVRRSSDETIVLPAAGHTPEVTESVVPATCTQDGSTTYVTVCKTCKQELGNETVINKALGHDWGKWITDPYDNSKQNRSCLREGCGKTEQREDPDHKHTVVAYPAKEAGCTTTGNIECYQCTGCYQFFKDEEAAEKNEPLTEEEFIIPVEGHKNTDIEETIVEPTCTHSGYHYNIRRCSECGETMTYYLVRDEKLGHDWEETKYTWNKGSTKVKASRSCIREGCAEEESETVGVTCEVTKEPSCTEKGETTYTSETFYNEDFEVQTRTVEDIEPLGHDWGEPVYEWNSDNTEVTAERKCEREGCSCSETETVKATEETTTVPSCIEPGEITYTSEAFNNSAFEVQSKTEELEASGHDWSEWTEVKKATKSEEGAEMRSCKNCDIFVFRSIPKIDPYEQMGTDGTAVGPGASFEAAEKAILAMKSDKDPAGSQIAPLKLKSAKQTEKSVSITWKKLKKAQRYVIYGNKSGSKKAMKKLATVKGDSRTFSRINGAKLKKGTYYKFIIVALDSNNDVVSTSKVIHVATKGGKVCNAKKVSVSRKVIRKAKNLKAGKKLSLKAKSVKAGSSLQMKKKLPMRYASTNTAVARVSSKGVVTAVKKGSCYVYAYGQNGVIKRVKVAVR